MGTTEAEPETPAGYIQRVGHTATILREVTSDTAYGRRGGSLYPLVLLFIAALVTLTTYPMAALLPLILMGVWVGGQR